MRNALVRVCGFLAVLAPIAAFAIYDQQILIDRALNSPTLTVRYSGAKAALVEMRLNGISLGTRSVNPAKTSGETSFTLNLSSLSDGNNEIEVRLYDKSGKLLGSEKTIIENEDTSTAPVRLSQPKMGQTVNGSVDIKVGFGQQMEKVYVSFFIDDQFKAMTNAPPYTYAWDTTRESNGWHELEALIVDEMSITFKTRKVRVLVNNPSGRTERQVQPQGGTVSAANSAATSAPKPTAVLPKTATPAPTISSTVANTVAPTIAMVAVANRLVTPPGERAGVKAPTLAKSQTADARMLTPSLPAIVKNVQAPAKIAAIAPMTAPSQVAVKVSNPTPTQVAPKVSTAAPTAVAKVSNPAPTQAVTKPLTSAPKIKLNTVVVSSAVSVASTISIEKGKRLPDIGTFAIVLNSKILEFDVSPKVVNGIALAPIRHLFEQYGAKVRWEHEKKIVEALAEGKKIIIRVGQKFATVDEQSVELEIVPFLDKGRTMVPLSFIRETLSVEIEYDPATGHVLITSIKKG